jgi:hypothetical protein
VEFWLCKEGLLETKRGITGHFHKQRDMVCLVEKDTCKGINPIIIGGGNAIAKVG